MFFWLEWTGFRRSHPRIFNVSAVAMRTSRFSPSEPPILTIRVFFLHPSPRVDPSWCRSGCPVTLFFPLGPGAVSAVTSQDHSVMSSSRPFVTPRLELVLLFRKTPPPFPSPLTRAKGPISAPRFSPCTQSTTWFWFTPIFPYYTVLPLSFSFNLRLPSSMSARPGTTPLFLNPAASPLCGSTVFLSLGSFSFSRNFGPLSSQPEQLACPRFSAPLTMSTRPSLRQFS